jgi:phage-related tail fiber protein
MVTVDGCQQLSAVNLRGTGYAAGGVQEQTVSDRTAGSCAKSRSTCADLGAS